MPLTPKPDRNGWGLCLSGGGFRAALFHLGAVRRLNELGVLAKLRTISSVSGGSILAAHLANTIEWPINDVVTDFEARVAAPFRKFVSKDSRTRAIFAGLLPSVSSVEMLGRAYEERLTTQKLSELPPEPRFIFCATDMSYGVNFIFSRESVGDYQIGYMAPDPSWSVARAVAASSCFPPVFNPMQMKLDGSKLANGWAKSGKERDRCIADLRLTDGGNYDNMGLEPVWKEHETVLVSDGGGLFDFEGDKSLPTRLLRYTSIVERQALNLRKRWLIASYANAAFAGAYWGIGSVTENYESSVGYSSDITARIAAIRTDLDAFTLPEQAILENHGYLLAEAAARRHLPLPTSVPSVNPPFPDWMEEKRVLNALKKSDRRKLLGRG